MLMNCLRYNAFAVIVGGKYRLFIAGVIFCSINEGPRNKCILVCILDSIEFNLGIPKGYRLDIECVFEKQSLTLFEW